MRTIVFVSLIAAVGLLGGVVVFRGGGDANATRQPEAAANACGTDDFDRYDAGASVEGHKKSKLVRRCEPDVGAPTRINMSVTFYGSCEPAGSDGGCAPPVQVQSWPSCEHNLALYEKYPAADGTTEEYTRTTIRGVPAAIFEAGQRIELYTARSTLVVFAENKGLARATANHLVGVHAGRLVRATEDLPAPAKGAMEDMIDC
jgi:hypothetical protein